MSTTMPSISPTTPDLNRLVATEGKTLPLEGAELRTDARGGLARVVLVQRFKNPHAEPLSVTYKLPLPADAAVSGFVFHVGERTIRGVVEGRSEARAKFEQAIVEGKSAALLEEDRSSLFTQEIGNIPPFTSVVAEIEIDQPLVWLNEGSWEWRFPLAAAPRYLGAGPIEGSVGIDTASGDIGARASLEMSVRDAVPETRSPESPTHPLQCVRDKQRFDVKLGSDNKVALDRDVVVRWPVATLEPGLSIDVARPSGTPGWSSYGLLTLVPPSPDAGVAPATRDLSLLLDTSGSMSGEPLEQMKRIACALVDSLKDGDTLEMTEFSWQTRKFTKSPEQVTDKLKKKAWSWIKALTANGGTEMVTGVIESLRDLRPGSQRQVVMITDGLVGFERAVVSSVRQRLPESARFHAVGVGSAVNRSLLLPVARAGRGIEAIVGLGEDAERAAQRILSRTVAPLIVDLKISGTALKRTASDLLPDCFAGAPARIAVELDPNGGEIVVTGKMGGQPFERKLTVPSTEHGAGSESVTKLFAREWVEECEMYLTGDIRMAASSANKEIEQTGKLFGIATRLTSFIAISEEPTVDPRAPSRKETQPQALPYGMSAEGLGLRQGAQPPLMQAGPMMRSMAFAPASAPAMAPGPMPPGMGGAPPPPPAAPGAPASRGRMAPPPPPKGGGIMGKMKSLISKPAPARQEERSKKEAAPRQEEAESADFGYSEEKLSAMLDDEGGLESLADVPAEAAPEPYASQELADVIVARIVALNERSIALELVVPDEGLEFDLEGAKPTVVLSDGRVVEVTVLADRSTHPGSYAAGFVLRITLEIVDGPGADISRVHVVLANGVRITALA